jgi:hypothetical protein
MHTIFDVFKELIDFFKQNNLVLTVVAYELNQKDICSLQNSEVCSWILSFIEVFLPNDNKSNLMCSQVAQ